MRQQKIGVVDYGMGNTKSVLNAIKIAGGEAKIVSIPDDLPTFDKLILPGVGAFGRAMHILDKTGMKSALNDFKKKGNYILGICLGMQMAVIEAARNLIGVQDAGSEEFDQETDQKRFTPVVYHLKEWVQGNHKVRRKETDDKGGTMRLGAYNASLTEGSRVAKIYGTTAIEERHRHRYEVDIKFRDQLEEKGLIFS